MPTKKAWNMSFVLEYIAMYCINTLYSTEIFNVISETDDPNSILCAYPVKDCVMKFTYSELTNGKTNISVLKEPGIYLSACFFLLM